MSFDHAGTKPGLAPEAQEQKTLNMRCKNKGCDSIEVVEMMAPNNVGRHIYRCVKCNTTWGVMTGGSVDLG
jgi:hypothetical protein